MLDDSRCYGTDQIGLLIFMGTWFFRKHAHKPDSDWGEDDSSGKAVQPDHYPNVALPGGGYPEGKGHKTDAFCNKCKDQLVDGSCLRCDWGPQNRSVPVKNFPLDPFRDDKAGIRAGSWTFNAAASINWNEIIKYKSKSYKKKDLAKYLCELKGDEWKNNTEIAQILGVSIPPLVRFYKNPENKIDRVLQGSARKIDWNVPIKYKNDTYKMSDLAKYLCELEGRQYQSDDKIAKILGISERSLYLYYQNPKNGINRIKDPRKVNWNEIIYYDNEKYKKKDLAKYLCELEGDEWKSKTEIAQILGVGTATLVRYYQDPKNGINRAEGRKNWNEILQEINPFLLEELKILIKDYELNPENTNRFDYSKYLKMVGAQQTADNRTAIQRHLKRIIQDNNLLPFEELDHFIDNYAPTVSGKIQRTDENYVYFIQSPTSAKIGWTGHLPRRWTEHGEGNKKRDKSKKKVINEIVYNLDEGYTNEAPGAVIIGPIKNWKIAQWTETAIKRWFKSIGWEQISKDIHGAGFSEAIFKTGNDVKGERFPPEAMSLFMQRLIEDTKNNGGSLPKYTEEQRQEFASIFGNDPDLINRFFGENSALAKSLKPENVPPAVDIDDLTPTSPAIPDPVVMDPNMAPTSYPLAEEPIQEPYQRSISPFEQEVLKYEDMVLNGTAYRNERGDIVDSKTQQILWKAASVWTDITKTADVEGYSNWETFNTAVMMANEQATREYSLELVKQGGTPQDLANWALVTIVGPYNQEAIADAQEWNEIPYEERPTGKENMDEDLTDLTNRFDEIFGFEDNRADAVATTIDESLINWQEIYDGLLSDVKEDEEYRHNEGEHMNQDPNRYPLCPECNPEDKQDPDAPGETTIPENWTF
jgi:hypothetical protein